MIARIIAALPPRYWSAHIRLEGDAVLYKEGRDGSDQDFLVALPEHLQRVKEASCVRTTLAGNHTLPTLFVASGLFQSAALDRQSDRTNGEKARHAFSDKRLVALLDGLRAIGFVDVASRHGLLSSQRDGSQNFNDLEKWLSKMTPDQWYSTVKSIFPFFFLFPFLFLKLSCSLSLCLI